jgi:glycosyltransferase involved in cell wall biosynthesis
MGWRVTATSQQPQRLLRLCDMLWTAYRKRSDYDAAVVDVFSGLAFMWAETVGWTLRRLGKPYVAVLHGGNLPEFARRWPGRVRRLLSGAAKVVSPSRYLAETITWLRPDIQVIPNGLDLSRYPFRCRVTPQPALMWLRAFHRIYNPAMAPAVVAELAKQYGNVCLAMAGPEKDGALALTKKSAESLGVADRISFVGKVPNADVPAWLNRGDIFLNTTNVDNTPVSVLEAMACGLCVVSTNVGGVPYLVEDGKDGLLVPPDDAKAMAVAVRRIVTEPGLAERLSRNARAKAEQFDWSIILPEWISLLSGVVESSRG